MQGRRYVTLQSEGITRALCFSSTGLLAAGSDSGCISLWYMPLQSSTVGHRP